MKVVAWTLRPNPALGFELVHLEDLLSSSDVVSLHLRLSASTAGFLDRSRLGLMKRGAILINTARGGLVDEPALVDALRDGRLFGAGLDVFATDPLLPGHPLGGMSNVVLSPHCAGITPEALEAGLRLAVANIRRFFEGRPANVVGSAAGGSSPA
jgi:D-3-phosphoglycerate dehydrogenase